MSDQEIRAAALLIAATLINENQQIPEADFIALAARFETYIRNGF